MYGSCFFKLPTLVALLVLAAVAAQSGTPAAASGSGPASRQTTPVVSNSTSTTLAETLPTHWEHSAFFKDRFDF